MANSHADFVPGSTAFKTGWPMNFELSLSLNFTSHIKQSSTKMRILKTDEVKYMAPHMPIVAHQYLMSLNHNSCAKIGI